MHGRSRRVPAPRVARHRSGVVDQRCLLIAFLKLGDVVKWSAPCYTMSPRGWLVEQAGSGEVQRYNLNTMPELVSFAEPGRYALYTGDYDLLTITDALRRSARDLAHHH